MFVLGLAVAHGACPDPAVALAEVSRGDLEPRNGHVGEMRVLPRSGGFDLTWTRHVPLQRGVVSEHVSLDERGRIAGPWTQLAAGNTLAVGSTETHLLHLTTGNPGHRLTELRLFRRSDDGGLVPAAEPVTPPEPDGIQHSGAGIAWNPRDREWVVLSVLHRAGPGSLHLGRVAADGSWIPGSMHELAPGFSWLGTDTAPAIHWLGDGFGAVWATAAVDGAELVFARFSAQGTGVVLDVVDEGAGFSVGSSAWDGTGMGIAYTLADPIVDSRHTHAWFAYVVPGREVQRIRLASPAAVDTTPPALAWDGERFSAAWTVQLDETRSVIELARIGRDPVRVLERQRPELGPGASFVHTDALVYDGCRHALGYTHQSNDGVGWLHFVE